MMPADQRLHAHHPPTGEIDLGLVIQLKLFLFNGAAQVAEQGQPGDVAGVEVLIVQPVAADPGLGGAQGDVGALDQRMVIEAVIGNRAMPILAPRSRRWPSITNGWRSVCSNRRAAVIA